MKEVKGLDYYLGLPYRVCIERDPEGGFVVTVPELPGCISQGDTVEEAYQMIRDAMAAWISSALEHGEPVPEPSDYSGRILVRVSRSLHRELVLAANEEGVSLNQFISIQLAKAIGRRGSHT